MALPQEKRYTPEEFYSMDLPGRCELINGRIFIGENDEWYKGGDIIDMSPAPNYVHQQLVGELHIEIGNYIRKHKGKCKVFTAPADVKIKDSTVQPDVFVTCDPSKIDGQNHNGAPDWVIEVLSQSNSRRDTVEKLYLYREGGVREYWIVDPEGRRVIVYPFEECSPPKMSLIMYTFEDTIDVNIYKDASEPLTIRLADYF